MLNNTFITSVSVIELETKVKRRFAKVSILSNSRLSLMMIASATQFHLGNIHLAKCLNRVLNVKAIVAAFNQERALVGPSP